MNEFLAFLREYWFEIAAGVGFIIELIFIFIKRKPKSIDEFKLALDEVLNVVPNFIIQCEVPGEGCRKKNYCLIQAMNLMEKKLSRKLTDNEVKLVCDAAGAMVELVLSTPTKKESVNEK